MFSYDKDFVAEYIDTAIDFFIKFMWRFFLINILISVLPSLWIFYALIDNQNFYIIVTLASVILSFISTTITLWIIRKSFYRDKKNERLISMVFRTKNDENLSEYVLVLKIAFSFFWRSCLATMCIGLIALFLSALLNFNPFSSSGSPVFGLIGFFLGWYWFVLFNNRNNTFIDFKIENTKKE